MRSLASITGIRRRANSRPRERDQNQAAANTHHETVTVELTRHPCQHQAEPTAVEGGAVIAAHSMGPVAD